MKLIRIFIAVGLLLSIQILRAQTLSQTQMQNARASGYSIIAARNPGISFSVFVIPWDGVNSLEYNANHQINELWHPQAVIKGNFFNQSFDGIDFTIYSSVILSQEEFDLYKGSGTQWWIVCSMLNPFSNSNLNILGNGNVGIGITNPAEKLAVNGKIRAQEIKVEASNWPDYVFKQGYTKMPLTEIETFIKQRGHLPEIPSSNTIEMNGLELGEMNKLLLKKIEELTLHLIEINKQMKLQNDRLAIQQIELEAIRKQKGM